MNIVVVIPAYNEAKTVRDVVSSVFALHATRYTLHAIVVDDGSTDRTAQAARDAGAIVLQHPINRGLGAAIATGIAGALRMQNEECRMKNEHNAPQPPLNLRGGEGGVIVTLDADGQHDPAEIPVVIDPIVKGEADVVIGSRLKCRMQNAECRMPWHRIVANWFGNIVTWLLFGIWVSDSQSGFRAFSTEAARKLQLRTSTMEVSSEIIREIVRLKLQLKEVPITVRYTAYSLSKGQGFIKGIETLWKLIVLKFFR